MQLDQQHEDELAKRKGRAVRTVVTLVWLGISLVGAYFLVTYLMNENLFRPASLYGSGLPGWVPQWAIVAGAMLLIVFVMQVLLWFGFILVSPEGRRKTGTPSMYSRNPDPLDKDRFY